MKEFSSPVALAAAAALFATGALAADLAPLRPSLPPEHAEAAAAWDGFYIGAGAGYLSSRAAQRYSISSATLAAAPPIIPVIDAAGSHDLALRGSLADVDVGYNWRMGGRFVLGVEADMGIADGGAYLAHNGTVPNFTPGHFYQINQSLEIDWAASLRARFGVTIGDRLMLFATAGPAAAQLRYKSAFTDYWREDESVKINTIRPGFALGVGAQYAFAPTWSLVAEYRYAQYSAIKGTGSGTLTNGTTAYISHSAGDVKTNLVRLGINHNLN